ncbi:MAG: hypothetical protein FVQ81_13265 [Candidatus Glassbacteria bacterium]|nr:hypothetical protein [Candidatus Glassbacteria bacterium]
MNWFEIFKTGTHTDSAGVTREWEESDLKQIVDNFDPEQSAPVVIGHPKNDDPAWGWVDKLKIESGKLLASFRDLVPEFVEAVKQGRYRKVSVRFFPTDNDGWELRHVGFLGAAAPAVKGLTPIAFEEREGDVVLEYALDEYEAQTLRDLFRGLREWIIDRFSLETANDVLPDWQIETLHPPAKPDYNQPEGDKSMGDPITQEKLAEAVSKAVKEATDLANDEGVKKEKAMQAEIENLRLENRRDKLTSFVEAQVKGGKLPPKASEAGIVEFMLGLDDAAEVEFAEGEEHKKTPLAWFREFIESMSESKLFGELAGREGDPGPAEGEEGEKIVTEYIAAQKEQGKDVSYTDAVRHVASRHPELFPV